MSCAIKTNTGQLVPLTANTTMPCKVKPVPYLVAKRYAQSCQHTYSNEILKNVDYLQTDIEA